MRRWVIPALLGLLLWAALAAAGFGVHAALGQAPGPPRTTQDLMSDAAEFTARVLRVPLRPLTVIVDDVGGYPATATAWRPCEEPGVVRIRAWAARDIDDFGAGTYYSHAVRLVLHEALHDGDCGRIATPQLRAIEEGVVDAVMRDLAPAWTYRLHGKVLRVGPTAIYEREALAIRGASRYAVGCRSPNCRAARLWRRQLLLAPNEERLEMIAAAERARG